MPIEIERKFLVTNDAWRQPTYTRICQGYLNNDKARTVRVRISGGQGYITIKGPTTGASRLEFEYQIPLADAEQLLALCDGPVIEKHRHIVGLRGMSWEVDEFFGDNAGLVVAEIELTSDSQVFERPSWLGTEVTDDARYFNSNLAVTPYRHWRLRS